MAVSHQLLVGTLRGAVVGGLVLQFPGALLLYYSMQQWGSSVQAPLPSLTTAYTQVCECVGGMRRER